MSILAAQPLIIDRITAQVVGFTTISNPSLVAGLRDIGPLLPGCFVMPGPGDIAAQQKNGAGVVEEQEWDVIIIVGHQHTEAADGTTETTAGTLMTGCIQALSGWHPGIGFISPFVYAGRAAPIYGLGYAEFPLTFTIKALGAG
jgi:hypothetical protein